MPDPAIDAINASLPYTEPTSGGAFKRGRTQTKVTFVPNPNNPSAPPRRIVDVDGGGGGGLFKRKWGGKGMTWGDQPRPSSFGAFGSRPLPQLGTDTGQPSSHSAAQGLGMAPTFDPASTSLFPLAGFGTAGSAQPSMLMQPLPDDFWRLSWRQRRHLRKMQAREEKAVWDWDKAQKQWEKAQRMEAERTAKEVYKARKAQLKAQEKQLKKDRKNPYRPMPTPTPATNPARAPAEPAPAAPANGKWMMMPTMEEFGVRRPFDHVGPMPQAGQGEWPMMSRTMTHAIIDMGREERVHAVSAGTIWGGGWGGHW